MPDFKIEPDSISFWVRVKPRAQRDRLKEGPGGELLLELHAAPVDGEANDACVRFFARALKIPQTQVNLAAGERSRRKLVRISGRPGEEILARITTLVRQTLVRRAS